MQLSRMVASASALLELQASVCFVDNAAEEEELLRRFHCLMITTRFSNGFFFFLFFFLFLHFGPDFKSWAEIGE